jgi:hypothetical protein
VAAFARAFGAVKPSQCLVEYLSLQTIFIANCTLDPILELSRISCSILPTEELLHFTTSPQLPHHFLTPLPYASLREKEYSTMEKIWNKETRPLTMSPAQGTVSVRTMGRLAGPTNQAEAIVTGAAAEDEASRRFLLRVVQPGLVGLMDGSVSTLAPIFATAFATHRPFTAFLVGIAAALGAGISMAFSEALSDDGVLPGRGSPIVCGSITGAMTFLGGSLHN